jgi:hypothetical protein
MGHLRDAADRLHLPPPPPSPPKPQPRPPEPGPEPAAAPLPQPPPSQQQEEEATAARPWNLRDRKCRRPTARGAAAALDASPAWEVGAGSEKARRSVPHQERAPFAVALTAEEVEEDVYALTGARPRRRPRKRPRVVQRQLDVRPIPHTAPRAPRYAFSALLSEHKYYYSSILSSSNKQPILVRKNTTLLPIDPANLTLAIVPCSCCSPGCG